MTFPALWTNLRHVTSSWNAAGLVERAWLHAGLTRDELSARTGIDKGLLSRYNGGQPLGYKNAERIASATGLTIFDLGAPAEAVPAEMYRSVLDRLQAVETALSVLGPDLEKLAGVVDRVTALEQRVQPRRGQGGR